MIKELFRPEIIVICLFWAFVFLIMWRGMSPPPRRNFGIPPKDHQQ